jgi:hypothetical protein
MVRDCTLPDPEELDDDVVELLEAEDELLDDATDWLLVIEGPEAEDVLLVADDCVEDEDDAVEVELLEVEVVE